MQVAPFFVDYEDLSVVLVFRKVVKHNPFAVG